MKRDIKNNIRREKVRIVKNQIETYNEQKDWLKI